MYMGHENIIKEFSMIRLIKEHLNIDLSQDEVHTLRNEIRDDRWGNSWQGTDEIIKSYHLNDNHETLERFFKTLKIFDQTEDYGFNIRRIDEMKNYFEAKYFKDLDSKIEVFSKEDIRYIDTAYLLKDKYAMLFNEEEQHSLEVIEKLLNYNPRFIALLFPYIKESDKLSMFDKYPDIIYKYARFLLTDDDKKYLFSKIKKENKIFMSRDKDQYTAFETIALRNKSILPRKLKEMYGKSYTEKTGLSIDDEDTFIYTLLNSNVLDNVFRNPVFNNDDIVAINTILNIFEDRKKDVANIRKRIEEIKEKTSIEENRICNYILANKDNEKALEDYLQKNNITRENFFTYIKGRKFLDKKLKEAILLILAKHYKTDYISVYDILDLIEESKERGISFYEVLSERNIDKKFFNNALNRLKEENPTMYDLIYESMNNDFSINKKMIRLYNSIISSKIKDYDSFVSRYKKTPEEVLEMFEGSTLFDEIHDSLLKWYDFKKGLPEEKNKKEI